MKQGARFATTLGMLCLLGLQPSFSLPLSADAETSGPARPPDAEAGRRIAERERRVEGEKRLLLRTLEDLRALHSLAARETAVLERETDAITPLEAAARERDLHELVDWYYGYSDWLKEKLAELDGDLARLSSGRAQPEGSWPGRYAGMAAKFKGFEKQLAAKARRFDREANRLAQIIDRRRVLQGSIADLEERLARIEKRLAERRGERGRDELEAAHLSNRIRVVQSEILALPLVDEDILKHYANLSERARSEGEWLLVKSDEYDALSEVSAIIAGDAPGNDAAVEAALGRVRRVYEREIERLRRMIEAIDRKRSRVSPAGSLREVERSAELLDFYAEQKRRYEDYIDRLKVQIGALEADLSELSGR